MSPKASPEVAEVVARFFEDRQQGRRASIDEVLGTFRDSTDLQGMRASALREIALRARTIQISAGSSEDVGDFTAAGLPEFPELANYDVVDVVGRGGMGVVYEAYQQSTGRRVAIKFMLRAAECSASGRRRFEREIELAARLQHPGIVPVIDSGIDQERYYYVMEYVEGQALDQILTPDRHTPREVLEVLAAVAETVDYAHQRGVLHRDLKPSNVLIDEHGRPRLLDFGLAKAIDPDTPAGVETTLSEPGQLIGTLAYMPPEQSRGQFELMSVRSDVYALGAMTYELLTGRPPCSVNGALADVLQRIAERDPVRPSQLRRGLDADVDAILLKTLEKSPERRYPTAGEFAADLRRYLADEPIAARPAGPVTHLMRWVRRNRGVAGAAVISFLLLGVVVVFAFGKILDQRNQAQRMMKDMQEFLVQGDPDRAPGADVTLREKFDEWERRLDEYEDEPEMEECLRVLFGRLALLHGEYDRAERNFRRVVELHRTQSAAASDRAGALFYLARALHKKSQYLAAERCYREALEIRESQLAPRAADIAENLTGLAWVLKDQNKFEDALTLYTQALEIYRERSGEHEAEIADAANNLGMLYRKLGRYEEAEDLFREALRLRRAVFGAEHRHVASTMANLGAMLCLVSRLDEAEPLLRDALALRERLLGPTHPDTIVSMNQYGMLLFSRGNYIEAERVLRRTHDLRIQAHDTELHDFVAVSKLNLAVALIENGKYAEAEELLAQARAIWEVLGGFGNHGNTASLYYYWADLCRATGRYAEAHELCEQALKIRRTIYARNENQPEIGFALYLKGCITLETGDPVAAEPLLTEALEILRRGLGDRHWRTAICESVLGECLTARERFEEAEPYLEQSFETLRDRADIPERDTLLALQRLIDMYDAWPRADRAAAYRELLPAPPDQE